MSGPLPAVGQPTPRPSAHSSAGFEKPAQRALPLAERGPGRSWTRISVEGVHAQEALRIGFEVDEVEGGRAFPPPRGLAQVNPSPALVQQRAKVRQADPTLRHSLSEVGQRAVELE